MANSISSIAIAFGIDSKAFDRGLQGISSKLGGLRSIVGMVSAAFAGVGAAGVFGWGLRLASEAELASAQLEVLLGSASKAKQMLSEIRALDVKSPFGFQELSEASKRMLAYGIAAEDVIPVLTRLSEVALGDAFKLDRLAYAMGQVKAAGKMTAQDMRQFTEAGLNPLQEIFRLTGVSVDELQKKVADGAISYELIALAIEAATSETGRFYGANERFARTLTGEWAKLTAEAQALGREIGNTLVPAARQFIAAAQEIIKWLRSWDTDQIKLTATIVAFGAGSLVTIRILAALPAVIGLIVKAVNTLTTAMILNMTVAGGWGGAAKAFGVVLGGLVAAGLIKSQFDELEKSMKAAADAAKEIAKETGALEGKLPDGVLEIKKKMEALLGLTPGSTAALNNFAKEARALRPAALLKNTSEAQSAINARNKLNINPPQKEVVNKLGVLHMDLQAIAGILRGQKPQQLLPANV